MGRITSAKKPLTLLAGLFILALAPAYAGVCQCAQAGSPCEEFVQATAVFIGTVTGSEKVKSGVNFTITSERVFKGAPEKSILFFSCFECMCGWGYEFSVGGQYLIYA